MPTKLEEEDLRTGFRRAADSLCRRLALGVVILLVAWPGAGGPVRAGEGSDSGFTFVAIGDNRPQGVYKQQPAIFDEVLHRVKDQDPDFVISTGDGVYGYTLFARDTRRQYREFLEKLKILSCPFYSCPGNHDVSGEAGWRYFKKHIGKPYSSFWHKGSFFILLNSVEEGANGAIVGKQLGWLKEQLERSESKGAAHLFVALHYPLFIPELETRKTKNRQPPSGRDSLHGLFVAYGVDRVFCGHEHYYHRQEVDGVVYIITAGAGAPLYAAPEEGGFHHFVKVTVRRDQVRDEVVRVYPSDNP
jgi:hypothetical protein